MTKSVITLSAVILSAVTKSVIILSVVTCFSVSLRDMCVHCLLFTESGRTLLDIISLGVDTVELALASQHRYVATSTPVYHPPLIDSNNKANRLWNIFHKVILFPLLICIVSVLYKFNLLCIVITYSLNL